MHLIPSSTSLLKTLKSTAPNYAHLSVKKRRKIFPLCFPQIRTRPFCKRSACTWTCITEASAFAELILPGVQEYNSSQLGDGALPQWAGELSEDSPKENEWRKYATWYYSRKPDTGVKTGLPTKHDEGCKSLQQQVFLYLMLVYNAAVQGFLQAEKKLQQLLWMSLHNFDEEHDTNTNTGVWGQFPHATIFLKAHWYLGRMKKVHTAAQNSTKWLHCTVQFEMPEGHKLATVCYKSYRKPC